MDSPSHETPQARGGRFELSFAGSALVRGFPRHRRWHRSVEEARETAGEVRRQMQERDIPQAAHPAVVYGPGCGRDGTPV